MGYAEDRMGWAGISWRFRRAVGWSVQVAGLVWLLLWARAWAYLELGLGWRQEFVGGWSVQEAGLVW
jgi:hypothetical protein